MLEDIFINRAIDKESMFRDIEVLTKELRVNYIDAVMHYCEANNLEIETIASLIKSNVKMKAKLQEEAEELNYLPKRAKLPIGD